MNAKDFERALTVLVPKKIHDRTKAVVIGVVGSLAAEIASGTPVQTGYLRGTMAVTAGDEAPPTFGERDPNAPDGAYLGLVAGWQESARSATERALEPGASGRVTVGFTADYAPEVEDRERMVAHAFVSFPVILDGVVRSAEGGS